MSKSTLPQAAAPEAPRPEAARFFSREWLREGLRGRGCAVCNSLEGGDRERMTTFLREGMMNPDARSRFLTGEGFCPSHWSLAGKLEQRDPSGREMGVAILAEQLMERWLTRIQGDSAPRPWWRKQRNDDAVWPPRIHCLICEGRRGHEQLLISVLSALPVQDELRDPIASRLCALHAWMALNLAPPNQRESWKQGLLERLHSLRNRLLQWIHPERWNGDAAAGDLSHAPTDAVEYLSGREAG